MRSEMDNRPMAKKISNAASPARFCPTFTGRLWELTR